MISLFLPRFQAKFWLILPKTSEIILDRSYFPKKMELTQLRPQAFSFPSLLIACAIDAFFRFRQTLAGYKEFIVGGRIWAYRQRRNILNEN